MSVSTHGRTTINLRQLGYFVRVVDAGNITAAAEQLNMAQPALGVQIRQLESELGIDLLVRHSRGVLPTQAGTLLYERALRIIAEVDATQAELRALRSGQSDHVVLGIPPSIMLLLGTDLMIEARDAMAGVSVSLVEERSMVLLDALDREQINIAFAWNVHERPDLERRALLEEDLLLVTSPSNAPSTETVSLSEALAHDLVIAGERGVIRNIVQGEARRLGLTLRLAFEVHSVTSMKALIGRGGAATIMPYSLAPRELSSGELVGRRIERPTITRTLYRVRPVRRPAFANEARIGAFLDGLIERLLVAMGSYARSLR